MLSLKNWVQTLGYFYALGAMALASGCGAQNNRGSVGPENRVPAASAASAMSTDEWQCPSAGQYNVTVPVGYPDRSSMFRVCKSRLDGGRLHISGITQSEVVCVYPMNYAEGASTAEFVDRRKCYRLGSEGTVATFSPTKTLNYTYIVDGQYTTQFESCMTSSATACPSFAVGKL